MGYYRGALFACAAAVLVGCRPAAGPAAGPADVEADGPGCDLTPPAPDAGPVRATERMPGIYPAGSRVKDPEALGGFGPCTNYPKDLGGRDWGAIGAVSVVAFPDEPVGYFKRRGFTLRVVNRTGEAIPFAACDSALSLVREARDAGGAWREVEAPPRSSCGNSYHRVFLKPQQYWEFPAREYAGPVATRVRFRLDPGGGRPVLYSNEFDGQVAAVQFAGGE